MHWVNKYIGKHSYNCGSLVYNVLKNEFNKEIPEVNANNILEISKLTKKIKKPEHGAIAIMKNDNSHIGLYLKYDGGGILHCLEKTGVIFQTHAHLRSNGWKTINYYKLK